MEQSSECARDKLLQLGKTVHRLGAGLECLGYSMEISLAPGGE